MKKTILIMVFILCLPLIYSLHGGETWSYHFNECDILRVNITGNLTIDEGEYTILNNCTKNQTNYYVCDCDDDYDFDVTFRINTINNYTFVFNYDYSKDVEPSKGGGGGGGGSSRRTKVCTQDWNCTEWTNCQSNKATRKCNDLNECNATKLPEERYCYSYVATAEPTAEPVEQVIDQPQEEQDVIEPTEPPIEEEQKKGVPFGLWIILSVFVLIVVVLLIVYLINRKWTEN